MAIDTTEKLFSMLNFGDGAALHLLPEADPVIGADDRLHLLDLYSGIAVATVGFTMVGTGVTYAAATMPRDNWYFEADMLASAGTLYARMWDATDSAAVADSQVSTGSPTLELVRSVALTVVDGHVYRSQYGTIGADAGKFNGAKLIGI